MTTMHKVKRKEKKRKEINKEERKKGKSEK